MDKTEAKHVSESETEQIHVVFQSHLNPAGRLFGGTLVSWIDVLAGVVAQRHCGGYATTAEIDKLDFKSPIYIGSTLVIHGKVTCVGRTSMEVKVDTFTEEYSGERKLVNTAYLVLVACSSAFTSFWWLWIKTGARCRCLSSYVTQKRKKPRSRPA